MPFESSLDQKRPNYVGEKVIKKMYNTFISKPIKLPEFNETLENAICVDLDGTLALHTSGRSPYQGDLCEEDSLNPYVNNIIEAMYKSNIVSQIILVSGRPGEFRTQTVNWLTKNAVRYSLLLMRQIGDSRPDDVIKQEIYYEHIHDRYNVLAWFDDRLRVSRMVHNLGLPLFRVGDPDADF